MSAKLKKRLLKLENKVIKLEKLQLKDVVCSICQSILIEPVTLPCKHYFCQHCFNGSVENNALCCPLCRLRIGSWLRTATKQKNLVNVELWEYIQSKFSKEIDVKLKGEDVIVPDEKYLPPRLSAPGEIRSEYEAELKRLKAERLLLEQKHMQETELLIKKIQEEEQESQKKYLERLKQDEVLAKQLVQQEPVKAVMVTGKTSRVNAARPRLKATKIDGYLSRGQIATVSTIPAPRDSPLLTDDSTNSDSTCKATIKSNSRASPEVVPSYGKIIKNLIDHKVKTGSSFWNKENGKRDKEKMNEKPDDVHPSQKETENNAEGVNEKTTGVVKSLLVSLPLPQSGILQHKSNITENKNPESSRSLEKNNLDKQKIEIYKCLEKQKPENCRNLETGSVDSMRLELCYFKPIEKTCTTGVKTNKSIPLRVPSVRADLESTEPPRRTPPSRTQYIEGLCHLRNISLSKNLPSAFVIALNILRVKQESARSNESRMTLKRPIQCNTLKTPPKKKAQKSKQCIQVDDMELARKMDAEWNGRRHLRRAPAKRQVTINYALRPPKKVKV
ncbi:E3 ubiquitin-protein ligase rnf168-like isoform X1 [Hyposmocoma kahamanoa]|uniref:E3 ubiquitin-protein ligase rnf168-like isoform X1 n=1 Tax=Hyposmocoma kahamanoa TaxID=1477025 RepID=UPI000E6D6C62|nr:E3 ubiquitin-protein ligase rnf168-like isoform X1 [Hyposmocoma kahamanoa]